MILEDTHIEYLLLVERRRIVFKRGKYLYLDGKEEHPYFNQKIPLHASKLGLTAVIYNVLKRYNIVSLTQRGKLLIQDESEAWG